MERRKELFKVVKKDEMNLGESSILCTYQPQAKEFSYLIKDYVAYLTSGKPPKKGFAEYCLEFPEWENYEYILINTLCQVNNRFDKFNNYINLYLYENLKKLREERTKTDLLTQSTPYNDEFIRAECEAFYSYKSKEIHSIIGMAGKIDDCYYMMVMTALIYQKLKDEEELDLTQNYIIDVYIQPIISALKFTNKIKKLLIPYNHIGEEGSYWLGTLLRNSQDIIELDISYCKLNDNGLRRLIQGLSSTNQRKLYLKKINLSCNEISSEGGKAIGELIELFSDLKWLTISKNKLKNEGFKHILLKYKELMLESKTILDTLIIHNNFIEPYDSFEVLARIVEHPNCTFTSLVLNDNNLTVPSPHKYLQKFFHAMKKNTSIIELLFLNCNLSNDIVDDIYIMLCENKKLEKLCLYHNNINEPSKFLKIISCCCGTFPRNTTLKDLDLSKNQCRLPVTEELLNLIRTLHIQSIDICQNIEFQTTSDMEKFKLTALDQQSRYKIIY